MFYVYLHIKKDTGEPFYVGKGHGNRCSYRSRQNNHWTHIVNKHGLDVIFLEENLDEKSAFEQEIYWINRIGRIIDNKGPLVNITTGGEGSSGRSWNGTRLGTKNPMYGHKQSIETKQKISDTKSGIPRPPHVQEILRNAGKGKIGELSCRYGTTHSEETKEKMRIAWQKRKQNKQNKQ